MAAAAHLRQAARKLAGDQRTQAAVRRRLLPRLIHTDERAAGGREEEAMTAIRDKKEELRSMIAEARRSEHRIGWRNKGLLWYLSTTQAVHRRRPHGLDRRHLQPYTAESTFSKLRGFTITSALLLLSFYYIRSIIPIEDSDVSSHKIYPDTFKFTTRIMERGEYTGDKEAEDPEEG